MFFNGLKVLVAGGTGMIGIPLVKLLLKQGAHVRIASLDDPSRAHPSAEFIQLDLTRIENCRKVCKGVDFVFNLLGVKASPAITVTKPASFFYPTVMMELNMLEASRLEGVSGYLLASSIGVYSPAEILCEDDVWTTFPSSNDWFSGWAKRIGELQMDAYKKEYRWESIAVVRPANVYGPYDNFNRENAMVVPSLIKKALSDGDTLKVWGDGTAVRDFIHSRDVARGMLLVAEKMPGKPVNLGSGAGVSIKVLVETIVSCLEQKPMIVWDRTKPQGDKQRILDISTSINIGFKPEVSLKEGIREVIEWYRRNRDAADLRYDVYKDELSKQNGYDKI